MVESPVYPISKIQTFAFANTRLSESSRRMKRAPSTSAHVILSAPGFLRVPHCQLDRHGSHSLFLSASIRVDRRALCIIPHLPCPHFLPYSVSLFIIIIFFVSVFIFLFAYTYFFVFSLVFPRVSQTPGRSIAIKRERKTEETSGSAAGYGEVRRPRRRRPTRTGKGK